eukprot:CAMPEP_0176235508 /NCGR_PEP_ID=MMETSP0121_2-20121125/26873_1 /TAXON_ID=160619 /ORGANISM="Kryptoperidinium foliaceum, Strain CCMP 1326" /LENGTH=351 /DNA_ID=CAMNT_0017574929 /DNA_START=618 /DNA_END=1670 /DNA_ORIENTATION=-
MGRQRLIAGRPATCVEVAASTPWGMKGSSSRPLRARPRAGPAAGSGARSLGGAASPHDARDAPPSGSAGASERPGASGTASCHKSLAARLRRRGTSRRAAAPEAGLGRDLLLGMLLMPLRWRLLVLLVLAGGAAEAGGRVARCRRPGPLGGRLGGILDKWRAAPQALRRDKLFALAWRHAVALDVGKRVGGLLAREPAQVPVDRDRRCRQLELLPLERAQLFHEPGVRSDHLPPCANEGEGVRQGVARPQHKVGEHRRRAPGDAGAAVHQHRFPSRAEAVDEVRRLGPEKLDGLPAHVLHIDAAVLQAGVELHGGELVLPHAAHHGADALSNQRLGLLRRNAAAQKQAVGD